MIFIGHFHNRKWYKDSQFWVVLLTVSSHPHIAPYFPWHSGPIMIWLQATFLGLLLISSVYHLGMWSHTHKLYILAHIFVYIFSLERSFSPWNIPGIYLSPLYICTLLFFPPYLLVPLRKAKLDFMFPTRPGMCVECNSHSR